MLDTDKLPVINGPVLVHFKEEDENEQTGEPVGDVTVIDSNAYDAWMAANASPGGGVPFGSKVDGVHKLTEQRWMSWSDAEKVAGHYGVTVEYR